MADEKQTSVETQFTKVSTEEGSNFSQSPSRPPLPKSFLAFNPSRPSVNVDEFVDPLALDHNIALRGNFEKTFGNSRQTDHGLQSQQRYFKQNFENNFGNLRKSDYGFRTYQQNSKGNRSPGKRDNKNRNNMFNPKVSKKPRFEDNNVKPNISKYFKESFLEDPWAHLFSMK
ncbi:3292_t:CDS:2 [Diversispora eburnea]|uniref:3292_t:CDS:1 n=1 Tax=Diversispora eburnea TaxID=1213867 RepID=A0A9N9A4Q3_9GLOM|nr:3292_t:CDS:2 [Diversispora eburnea]